MKAYKKDDLTIEWDAKKCIHSAICAKGLPGVFKPKDRPWVQPENATAQEIMDTVDKCPSEALTYFKGEKKEVDSHLHGNDKKEVSMENEVTKVEVKTNGPLLVSGDLVIINAEGKEEHKKRNTAFCRCGASANKPYCDGAHNEIGFQG